MLRLITDSNSAQTHVHDCAPQQAQDSTNTPEPFLAQGAAAAEPQ